MPRVAAFHCVLLALLALVDSRRVGVVEHAALSGNQTEESEVVGCSDYCVQCNDGSTVWYGRSRSWFRAFVNLFTEGLLVPLVAVGNMIQANGQETSTHWTGYLPTTGVMCEKVDIIKFPSNAVGNQYMPLMSADESWFGRIKLNLLKPYDSHAQPLPGFMFQDDFAYKKGCKTVKSSGWRGTAKQLKSIFDNLCESRVTEGVFQCSTHSRLCGDGGVRALVPASSPQQCQLAKNSPQHSKCVVPSRPGEFMDPAYHHAPWAPGKGMRSMEVMAPQGTFAGQQIVVYAPDTGAQLMVTIPHGITGGQVFKVEY